MYTREISSNISTLWRMLSVVEVVQYCGRYSGPCVNTISTVLGYRQYCGEYSVQKGDNINTMGG